MQDDYDSWIDAYVYSGKEIHGQCFQVCQEMLKVFPELVLRAGYVRTWAGTDLHWWLTTEDGTIVDPTEAQFGGLQPEDYFDCGKTAAVEVLTWYLGLTDEQLAATG